MEKRVQTLKKKLKDNKPENEYYSTNRYEMTEEEVIKIFNKAFTLYDIIPSDTIYPKRMKDFGKFGHVSELILEKKTDEYKIYGSCWKNKNQFLEMMKKYNNSPGSPFVGLRIVMIFDNAEVYKNPFY